jgi:hypothetical protein
MSEDTRNPTGAAHPIGKTGEDKTQNVAPVSVFHVLADASCFVEYPKPLHWQSSDKAPIELAHAIGESLLINALSHASHSKSHISTLTEYVLLSECTLHRLGQCPPERVFSSLPLD